jgi:hypothetical protein
MSTIHSIVPQSAAQRIQRISDAVLALEAINPDELVPVRLNATTGDLKHDVTAAYAMRQLGERLIHLANEVYEARKYSERKQS